MTPNRRTGAQCDGESKGEYLRNSRGLRYLLGCLLRARLACLLRLSLLRLRGMHMQLSDGSQVVSYLENAAMF